MSQLPIIAASTTQIVTASPASADPNVNENVGTRSYDYMTSLNERRKDPEVVAERRCDYTYAAADGVVWVRLVPVWEIDFQPPVHDGSSSS